MNQPRPLLVTAADFACAAAKGKHKTGPGLSLPGALFLGLVVLSLARCGALTIAEDEVQASPAALRASGAGGALGPVTDSPSYRPPLPVLAPTQILTESSTIAPGRCANLVMDGDTLVLSSHGTAALDVVTKVSGRWQLQARLSPTLPLDYYLGYPSCLSVALQGDTLVVGAHDLYNYRSGSAWMPQGALFVFERSGTTWVQRQTVLGFAAGLHLGLQVALAGDLVVAAGMPDHRLVTYRRTGSAGSLSLVYAHGMALRSEPRQLSLQGSRLAIADGNPSVQIFDWDGVRFNRSAELNGPVGMSSPSAQLYGNRLAALWAGTASKDAPPASLVTLYEDGPGGWRELQVLRHPRYPSQNHVGLALAFAGAALVTHEISGDLPLLYREIGGVFYPRSCVDSGGNNATALVGDQLVVGVRRVSSSSSTWPAPRTFTLPAL